MIYIEDVEMTRFLIEHAGFLIINNSETARAILTALIGGLITLTVFNFSMVMLLLNQASSNYSPRLLPGLISDRPNQVVLGFYIGTLLYEIIVLISILPSGDEYTLNGFSILIGIILGIFCLALFVYFIHHISRSIRIDIILMKIFNEAQKELEQYGERQGVNSDVEWDDEGTEQIESDQAGYVRSINLDALLTFAEKNEINIKVLCSKGDYLLPDVEMIQMDQHLSSEQREELKEYIQCGGSADSQDDFSLSIKQITEVGVKAMSPGINDPGTAAMTIDHLTELFAQRMQLDEFFVHRSDDGAHQVTLSLMPFSTLLHRCLAAYRQYCKHDVTIMTKLIEMLVYLKGQSCQHEYYTEEIKSQLKIMAEDVHKNINNSFDLDHLIKMLPKIEGKDEL
jgi:uncharacterized membrane protein